jgi:aryl-alcohol dehydrogenase-like predicted oxidoreductase
MYYRQLGSSDLRVSELTLGSWLTYAGGVEKQQAVACVRQALDVGINFIDTANIYGRGIAESVLGEALSGVPRDAYVLTTKVFYPMTEQDRGLSRAQIIKQLDASLQRLRTDHIDLYQCHEFDTATPLEETLQALGEAVQSGKVRYIGFSNWSPEQIRAALALEGVERFVSSQPQYSMLWREPEKEIIPLCSHNGISQMVWSPLAQGVLTGKYLPGSQPPADSRLANPAMSTFFRDRFRREDVLCAVQELKAVAAEAGLSLAQMALAWVLREPNVATAIIGASRPEQIVHNVAASGVKLAPPTVEAIERILGKIPAPV